MAAAASGAQLHSGGVLDRVLCTLQCDSAAGAGGVAVAVVETMLVAVWQLGVVAAVLKRSGLR
jgi:hypothetical protein